MKHDLTTEDLHIADLATYHRNPRQHDIPTIRGSLLANGMYRPIVVNRGTHTGRQAEVLAGNGTLEAHRLLANEEPTKANPTPEDWTTITGSWVDVDEDQAARIVAVDNRSGDKATYDDRLLAELLGDLEDLEGTGYDPGDLESLQHLLDDAAWNNPDEGGDPGEPDEEAFHPEIKLTVAPHVFEAWHQLLSSYEGKDDATKLAAHLRATGHLT